MPFSRRTTLQPWHRIRTCSYSMTWKTWSARALFTSLRSPEDVDLDAQINWKDWKVAVCQNLVPLVNIKIAGKWMFIPLKMVLIGIDPYPYLNCEPLWASTSPNHTTGVTRPHLAPPRACLYRVSPPCQVRCSIQHVTFFCPVRICNNM